MSFRFPTLLSLLLCLGLSNPPALAETPAGGGMKVNDTVFRDAAIANVTAVTRVFGRGQRITGVIVEFTAPLSAAGFTGAELAVADRNILSARVTSTASMDATAQDGRFVVLDLNADDEAATIFASGVDQASEVVVTQTAPLALADGGSLEPGDKGVINTRQVNLIVDDFQTFRYTDPGTGLILDYNLFIPKDYDATKPYPMVVFLHDAGVTGTNQKRVLEQGLGAVSFASPEDQAKHPAFVLAPQFPVPLANDASQTSDYADVTARLIAEVSDSYAIDQDRIYATGQSGGCMTSIALNLKYPDLFAASLLVAGQWDPAVVAPLARDKIWAIVSEDDAKAFPGMTAIMDVIEENGTKVTRSTWNAKASHEELAKDVADARAAAGAGTVFFTTFTKGSVLPEDGSDNPGAGHVNTWVYAYDIPGVRDWLLAQTR